MQNLQIKNGHLSEYGTGKNYMWTFSFFFLCLLVFLASHSFLFYSFFCFFWFAGYTDNRCRTARELVPVMNQLIRQKDGPLRKVTQKIDDISYMEKLKKPDWALVERIGCETTYEYINLIKNITTCDDITPSPPLPNNNNNNNMMMKGGREGGDNNNIIIVNALANIELRQQQKTLKWLEDFPLLNPWHENAIKCQDEYDLGDLEFQVNKKSKNHNNIIIEPSPLISHGLDRSYILEKICNNKRMKKASIQQLLLRPSKDLASNLFCQIVKEPTLSLQKITRQHRKNDEYYNSAATAAESSSSSTSYAEETTSFFVE